MITLLESLALNDFLPIILKCKNSLILKTLWTACKLEYYNFGTPPGKQPCYTSCSWEGLTYQMLDWWAHQPTQHKSCWQRIMEWFKRSQNSKQWEYVAVHITGVMATHLTMLCTLSCACILWPVGCPSSVIGCPLLNNHGYQVWGRMHDFGGNNSGCGITYKPI